MKMPPFIIPFAVAFANVLYYWIVAYHLYDYLTTWNKDSLIISAVFMVWATASRRNRENR